MSAMSEIHATVSFCYEQAYKTQDAGEQSRWLKLAAYWEAQAK